MQAETVKLGLKLLSSSVPATGLPIPRPWQINTTCVSPDLPNLLSRRGFDPSPASASDSSYLTWLEQQKFFLVFARNLRSFAMIFSKRAVISVDCFRYQIVAFQLSFPLQYYIANWNISPPPAYMKFLFHSASSFSKLSYILIFI